MSWSISAVGKPEELVEALDMKSIQLAGQSKIEYDNALPHLKALVQQNFGTGGNIQLSAHGSGLEFDRQQLNRSCSVSIKQT